MNWKKILLVVFFGITVSCLAWINFINPTDRWKVEGYKVVFVKKFRYADHSYVQLKLFYDNCSRCFVILEIPETTKRLNLAYVVHGGGFIRGRATGFSNMAKFFLERGYAVASVEYRLCTDWDWLTVIGDIARGVKTSQQYLEKMGYMVRKKVYIGSSAGAVAGAVLIYEPPTSKHDISGLVNAFIGLSGGYCISALPEWRYADSKVFCNTSIKNIMPFDDLEKASPKKVPALLINGDNDRLLDRNAGQPSHNTHAECMKRFLEENGIYVKVVIINGGHVDPMLRLIEKNSLVAKSVEEFLRQIDTIQSQP